MTAVRFLLIALLSNFVCNAQDQSSTTQKIIGGTATTISNYPYLVSIETYEDAVTGWDPDCGGSILSPTLILTAAHCVVENPTLSAYRVRAGSSARGSGGQVRRLRSIAVHPKYNYDTDDYDVAVLTLSSALSYSERVRPVSIVQAGQRATTGQEVFIAGWGVINTTTEEMPTQLMHTSLSVTSRELCQTRYRGLSNITSRMICALTANRDSCQGDSGGPMVDTTSRVQIGIVSFGFGCAEPGYPGVYTDLSNAEINSFIQSFLRAQTPANSTTTTPRPTGTAQQPSQASRPNPARPQQSQQPCHTSGSSRPGKGKKPARKPGSSRRPSKGSSGRSQSSRRPNSGKGKSSKSATSSGSKS